ncbi:MAG: hypothetical protein JWR38_5231 [Mucilaginibacter sp.]|nr:hypothetical protein [Mucilaginibacter sp.]
MTAYHQKQPRLCISFDKILFGGTVRDSHCSFGVKPVNLIRISRIRSLLSTFWIIIYLADIRHSW